MTPFEPFERSPVVGQTIDMPWANISHALRTNRDRTLLLVLDPAPGRVIVSRPLFANADLRKAVNYALDRRRIAKGCGFACRATEQYLQSGIPGFRDTHVYPLTPDLARAKRLARGHGGRAVLYAGVESGAREEAQLIRAELAPLGITVEIKYFGSFALGHIAGKRGEPFDMALAAWFPAFADPSNIINDLFDGTSIIANANN